ncbi:MAG: hypothetical protein WBX22_19745, partial [Silvibacterium sp.]
MKLTINITGVARPSSIAVFAVVLSLCAWLFPDFGVLRKGFTVAEHPNLISAFILFSWYLLIFVSLSLGQKLGASLATPQPGKSNIPPFDSPTVYWIFTILSTIGVISTYFRIFHTLSFLQAVLYISLGQANRLKGTLYDEYNAGILSLRYLVLYSASLAIYRVVRFRKLSLLSVVNIALLAMTALLSSRLILIATVLVSAFLLNYGKKSIKISMAKLGVFAGIFFAILSFLNSSR